MGVGVTLEAGRSDGSTVTEGNLMVARVSILLLFITCRGDSVWQHETPATSILFSHPRQVQLRRLLDQPPAEITTSLGRFNLIQTWLGAYGAATSKSIRLASNSACVLALKRYMSRQQIAYLSSQTRTYTKNELMATAGLPSITGCPTELRNTQGYPPVFALKAVEAWEMVTDMYKRRPLTPNPNFEMPHEMTFHDLWADLKLEEMAATLRLPLGRLIV